MPVITLPFGPLEANCHIVHNGQDAVVFDPSDDPDFVMNTIAEQGLSLRAVALTHLHCDHCLGCAGMVRASGVKPGRVTPPSPGWVMAASARISAQIRSAFAI